VIAEGPGQVTRRHCSLPRRLASSCRRSSCCSRYAVPERTGAGPRRGPRQAARLADNHVLVRTSYVTWKAKGHAPRSALGAFRRRARKPLPHGDAPGPGGRGASRRALPLHLPDQRQVHRRFLPELRARPDLVRNRDGASRRTDTRLFHNPSATEQRIRPTSATPAYAWKQAPWPRLATLSSWPICERHARNRRRLRISRKAALTSRAGRLQQAGVSSIAPGRLRRTTAECRVAWIGAVSPSLPVSKRARRYRPSVAVNTVIGYDYTRGPPCRLSPLPGGADLRSAARVGAAVAVWG
jgi:hypothetical protein